MMKTFSSLDEVLATYSFDSQRDIVKHGGQGVTYRGMFAGESVIIKTFNPQGAELDTHSHFMNEIKTLQQFDHDQIVRLVDAFELDLGPTFSGKAVILGAVYNEVPGDDLKEYRSHHVPNANEIATIGRSALDPLHYIHSKGVLHRDIKPSNIMYHESVARLIDFGLLRVGADQTRNGSTMGAGTPGYCAPEQLAGISDATSDLYGLGMTLFYLATGQDVEALAQKQMGVFGIQGLDELLKGHKVDTRLQEIILKATQIEPKDRYQNTEEFRKALDSMSGRALVIKSQNAPMVPQKVAINTHVSLGVFPFTQSRTHYVTNTVEAKSRWQGFKEGLGAKVKKEIRKTERGVELQVRNYLDIADLVDQGVLPKCCAYSVKGKGLNITEFLDLVVNDLENLSQLSIAKGPTIEPYLEDFNPLNILGTSDQKRVMLYTGSPLKPGKIRLESFSQKDLESAIAAYDAIDWSKPAGTQAMRDEIKKLQELREYLRDHGMVSSSTMYISSGTAEHAESLRSNILDAVGYRISLLCGESFNKRYNKRDLQILSALVGGVFGLATVAGPQAILLPLTIAAAAAGGTALGVGQLINWKGKKADKRKQEHLESLPKLLDKWQTAAAQIFERDESPRGMAGLATAKHIRGILGEQKQIPAPQTPNMKAALTAATNPSMTQAELNQLKAQGRVATIESANSDKLVADRQRKNSPQAPAQHANDQEYMDAATFTMVSNGIGMYEVADGYGGAVREANAIAQQEEHNAFLRREFNKLPHKVSFLQKGFGKNKQALEEPSESTQLRTIGDLNREIEEHARQTLPRDLFDEMYEDTESILTPIRSPRNEKQKTAGTPMRQKEDPIIHPLYHDSKKED